MSVYILVNVYLHIHVVYMYRYRYGSGATGFPGSFRAGSGHTSVFSTRMISWGLSFSTGAVGLSVMSGDVRTLLGLEGPEAEMQYRIAT